MDRDKFTAAATGTLVRIESPVRDWSFIPHDMPPAWQFPNELWPYLADAREAMAMLDGIGRTLPDPNLLLRPLQSREAITSSNIEGTLVTPELLLLYEIDPQEARSTQDKRADYMEVHNYRLALEEGRKMIDSGVRLGSDFIKSIHNVLMRGARGRDKTPGEFRTRHVHIGSNLRFIPPPHGEIPRLMENFSRYISSPPEPGIHPITKACIAHCQFEAIHPFADGNGRVGRALFSLMLYKSLRHSQPWLYLSAYLDRYKDQYIQNMFRVSTHGDWSNWIEFCLRGVVVQSKDAIKRCELFRQLQKKYADMVSSPTARTQKILDGLFSEPVLTIPALAARFHTTYHTARKDIRALVDAGILTEMNDITPKAFCAAELLRIAHSPGIEDIEL